MDELLQLIQARQQKNTRWNHGILTGDKYASTLQDVVGSDLCYRYGSNKSTSFSDAIKKASQTLTYNNEEMVVEDIYGTEVKAGKIEGIELPKNTLMAFRHILTTPKKDRDGDILLTKGAEPDPNMLLLWQHVSTLPIGKSLRVVKHTDDILVMDSCIVDMNELCHDAAVMIENKMGRFSHGFKATEFEAIKGGGFEIQKFEIMEESLVSVPANTDAEVLEVILDLVESDKLTSSMMKSYGNHIRGLRPKQVAGGLDINVTVDVKGLKDETIEPPAEPVDERKDESASNEEDVRTDEVVEEEDDTKDNKVTCKYCEGKGCEKCQKETETEEAEEKSEAEVEEKTAEPELEQKELTIDEMAQKFILEATPEQQEKLLGILLAMKSVRDREKETAATLKAVGGLTEK